MTMLTLVPRPTADSMENSSEYRFMFGKPRPAPKPISLTFSDAVE